MTSKVKSAKKATRDTLTLLGANLVALAVFALVPGVDVPWWLILIFFFVGKMIQDLAKHRKKSS